MKKTLLIHLDAPMQAWGIGSRYERRSAGEAPSKSALCGMVCAAMGAAKESEQEARIIRSFTAADMTSIAFTTKQCSAPILRDYHTVLGTVTANGSKRKDAVLSQRYYHQDKRFVVLLESEDHAFLEATRLALANPVWGIWLGRKCCIPAAPLIREKVLEPEEAAEVLTKTYGDSIQERFKEVHNFTQGTDTWNDQPLALGRADSSGREKRDYHARRILHTLGESPFFQGF